MITVPALMVSCSSREEEGESFSSPPGDDSGATEANTATLLGARTRSGLNHIHQ